MRVRSDENDVLFFDDKFERFKLPKFRHKRPVVFAAVEVTQILFNRKLSLVNPSVNAVFRAFSELALEKIM
jgi:hypothetical protein